MESVCTRRSREFTQWLLSLLLEIKQLFSGHKRSYTCGHMLKITVEWAVMLTRALFSCLYPQECRQRSDSCSTLLLYTHCALCVCEAADWHEVVFLLHGSLVHVEAFGWLGPPEAMRIWMFYGYEGRRVSKTSPACFSAWSTISYFVLKFISQRISDFFLSEAQNECSNILGRGLNNAPKWG